jgi:hypothetical protein
VLLKRKKSLTEQEQVKLDKRIQDAPLVKTAYEVKEVFFAIHALKSRHAAESALAKWEAGELLDTVAYFFFFLGAEGEGAQQLEAPLDEFKAASVGKVRPATLALTRPGRRLLV